MCGIAGVIPSRESQVSSQAVTSFLTALRHRGPDDLGFIAVNCTRVRRGRSVPEELGSDAVMIHRRLSILDLSPAGWQPMSSDDDRLHVVYNGEIYNYVELRRELEARGHAFRSRSDTEVLLHAYQEWGTGAFARFTGMFAFALLDSRTRKLLLVRDCFGIKPLYYTRWSGGLAFASEIKPLLELPGVSRAVNPNRLFHFLRWGLTDDGDQTFLKDVVQLPSAHYMEVDLDDPRPTEPVRYWSVREGVRSELSFDAAAEQLRELFLQNIRLHLRSDVPVGAALSGGIDSSSIVMAMRHLEPNLELHTFSYIAAGSPANEEKWVDIVTGAARAIPHKVELSASDLVEDLDRLVAAQDEPFGSTNIYAQYRVFRLAREAGIKVMLDGQGADELLAGYRHYFAARIATLVRHGRWRDAASFLQGAARCPDAARGRLLQMTAEYLLPPAVQGPARRWVGRELFPSWMDREWFNRRGVVVETPHQQGGKELFRQELHRSLTVTALPHLLRYEDRNSMIFSIESRVPFLTTEMADFLESLPDEYLLASDGTSKAVFRRAMRGIVPDAILDRKDKIGFETPEQNWLSALKPWVDRVISGESAEQITPLNLESLRQEWSDILAGRKYFNWRVWRWVNLIEWSRLMGATYE